MVINVLLNKFIKRGKYKKEKERAKHFHNRDIPTIYTQSNL